jgi:hypothetical protein
VAANVTKNANKALANAQAAAPAAASKNIKAAIRCITRKSDKGFYQLPRAYPCPPQDLPDGTKKGSITASILAFFDGSSKNTTKLTKSVVATQPAVAARVLRVLQSKGYAGGRRTRRNRF